MVAFLPNLRDGWKIRSLKFLGLNPTKGEKSMVKVTIITGEWAGRSRALTLADVEPRELFNSFVQHGDWWQVDYSQATEEEVFHFFRAELVVRIIRALLGGLPVRFQDQIYLVRSADKGEAQKITGDIEDAIVNSGQFITLEYDDERGVSIATRGFEH